MTVIEQWIKQIDPEIAVSSLTLASDNSLRFIHFTVFLEPELQVRMTGTSAAYMPGPVAYNGWKRKVSSKVKAVLSAVCPTMRPFSGLIKATMRFYVSNRHRWNMGDLNNYVKATEDMLNRCSHVYDAEEKKRWSDVSEAFPIWIDDRKVKRNGEGQGVYWVEHNPRIEIILEAIDLPVPASLKKKK